VLATWVGGVEGMQTVSGANSCAHLRGDLYVPVEVL
jgi:hypothetical protein